MANEYIRPVSDYTSTWTASSGSDLYAMVDESTPNDSDYIYTSSAARPIQNFTLGAPTSIPIGSTINSVLLRQRAKCDAAGQDLRVGFMIESTNYTQDLNMSRANVLYNLDYTWTTNPATSSAWTLEELSAGLVTVSRGMLAGALFTITQLFAYIDFTPPVIPVRMESYNRRRK